MKGSRELNNMKDTPSFKIKKVLALTKLRQSSTAGRKAAGPIISNAKQTAKKATSLKTKTADGKVAPTFPKGRRGRGRRKTDTIAKTEPEENKIDSAKEENEEEKPLEKKEEEEEASSPAPAAKKKLVKKRSKAEGIAKPERNLRSQIGEILMRHGKKVTKAPNPKPKRKRTLSSDFELLDEKSLKRKLKEESAGGSGTETDQNDSDASSAVDSVNSEDKFPRNRKKKSKTLLKDKSLDSSWVDCPSPLVESGKKSLSNSRDSSADGSEASIVVQREGTKQRTIRRLVDSQKMEEISLTSVESSQDLENRNEDKAIVIKSKNRRGRPPKRKRTPNAGLSLKETVDETKPVPEEDSQEEKIFKDSLESLAGQVKKQRITSNESIGDPYSFSTVDFEEEEDDKEVSFKPSGISGEVKRKPGRPKHGAAKQPAVRALKVKTTHKLLISDQKPRPFSRVRGGRILKASQIYRGSGRRFHRTTKLGLKEGLKKEVAATKPETSEVPSGEEPTRPGILPLKTVIGDQDEIKGSPLSPDIQHPDLTIIKDLTSPAPSNEDLEPPILEPADFELCILENKESNEEGNIPLPNEEKKLEESLETMPDEKEKEESEEFKVNSVVDKASEETKSVDDSQDVKPEETHEDVPSETPLPDDASEVVESFSQAETSPEVKSALEVEKSANEVEESSSVVDEMAFEADDIASEVKKTVNEMKDLVSGDSIFQSDLKPMDQILENSQVSTSGVNESTEVVESTSQCEEGKETINSSLPEITIAEGIQETMQDVEIKACETTIDENEVMQNESNEDAEKVVEEDLAESKEPDESKDQVDAEETMDQEQEHSENKATVTSTEEIGASVEEIVEKIVEDCLNDALDLIDSANVTTKTDSDSDKEKIDEASVSSDQTDAENKEKDAKTEMGGIKMKLKRHKGKFKVTKLSEDDGDMTVDSTDNKDDIRCDVEFVMSAILDEIDHVVDGIEHEDHKLLHCHDNEVFVDDNDNALSSSCSDISPTDSEKRVPPLTIRLKSAKTGKKPVRKFELRPKLSRSPIEIIAMRQKRYEEEYDKNEATRLARKLEKQTGKRKI